MENNNTPYAPSLASLNIESATEHEQVGAPFRDLSGITKKLSLLLWMGLGWQALSLVSSLMQMNMLSSLYYSAAEARANELRAGIVGLGELVLYIVTVCVFGRWIYLAHKNLPELGARHLRFTPGWSVGSFFVPLICLWGPYQAMRDLAKASRSPQRWDLEETSPVIVIWWVLWLLVQFLGNGLLRSSLHAQTVAELRQVTVITIVSDMLSVPLYFLARYIVMRVWRDQAESWERTKSVA